MDTPCLFNVRTALSVTYCTEECHSSSANGTLLSSYPQVETDPNELHDLATTQPALVNKLLRRLHELSADGPPRVAGSDGGEPSDAECAYVTKTGTWGPWEDDE
jgi:hypothetical protein